MKLEQQVTSLKLSKKLKELGCKQDSLFYWVESSEGQEDYRVQCKDCAYEYGNHRVYSAFTVAELYQLHYQKFGTLSKIPVNIDPTELTDYIARKICNKLIK